MNLNKQICGICGSVDYTLLFKDKWGEKLFKIVRCQNCGLVRTCPFPDSSSKRYENYPSKRYLDNKKLYISFFSLALKEILFFKKKGRFLEIGCSVGYLLELAKEVGFKINGIELSKDAARSANVLLGDRVRNCLIEDAKFPVDYFDVVAMYHVLEHIPNLRKMLKEVKRVLKNNGILFIGVPNFDNWIAVFGKKKWRGLRLMEHVWHFEISTIKKLLEKNGFQIVKFKILGPNIINIFLAMESLRRREGFLAQNYFHRLSIILHDLFYYLLSWSVGKISRGDNIFVIAIKKSQ